MATGPARQGGFASYSSYTVIGKRSNYCTPRGRLSLRKYEPAAGSKSNLSTFLGTNIFLSLSMQQPAPPRVVLELFQVRASPGVNVQSINHLPAEKEIRDRPHPGIVAVSDWGGPLVDRQGIQRQIAIQIVESARELSESIKVGKGSMDEDDKAWGNMLPQLYGKDDPELISRDFCLLASKCQQILKAQDTLVQVPAPCKIFGDLHGQAPLPDVSFPLRHLRA